MTLAELPLHDGPRLPPLAAFGPHQPNLVSVGSLSKLYWGGLRTGWIRGSEGLIARLAAAKAAADQGSTAFQQAIVAALLRGQHEDIVKWRGEWLRTRHDALAGALRASLPGWTWPEPDGGLSLWVRLPGEADSSAFAQAALRHGVAVVPGRLLSANDGGQSWRYVRLAFTQPPDVLGPRSARWPLYQGRPDEAVPGHQGGQLIGAERAGPGRAHRQHHVPGLRRRVPHRDPHACSGRATPNSASTARGSRTVRDR